jgi:CubicO group peptidase (beta-lactamase class C family)
MLVPSARWDAWPDVAAEGFDPLRVQALLDDCRSMGSGALLVVSRGRVLCDLGETGRRWIVQSARKSLLSVLFGVLWDRGILDLDATLGDLGIDDSTPLTERERAATIEHVLQSRSGVYLPAAGEYQSVAVGRPSRGSQSPGSHYWYNNWDFNVAGTVFQRLAGRSVYEAFHDWIALPTGMQDFRVEDGRDSFAPYSWHAAYHFVMSARDLARFGLLAARGGRWGDRQLVSSEWLQRSTGRHTETAGSGLGYGYMWWIGDPEAAAGHEWFAARGGAGHVVWVVPRLDLVIVHRNAGLLDTPTWDDVAGILGEVVDARADASSKSSVRPHVDRAVVPRVAGIAVGGGWVRHERQDLGVALETPSEWRPSDAGAFGERLRVSVEDGWRRRTAITRRLPWELAPAEKLASEHADRISSQGATNVVCRPATFDGRAGVHVAWTAADGARFAWYVATDGRQRFDITLTETQPVDDQTFERIIDSTRFVDPDLTDTQRRLRSAVPAHPIRRLPMNMDFPISSTYDFLAPRRTFPGQEAQRQMFGELGLNGGYVRSWSGQYDNGPANLQVFLLDLRDPDTAAAYVARQESSSDRLADIDGRVNTRHVAGTVMTTSWVAAQATAIQVQARGAAVAERSVSIARDLREAVAHGEMSN